MKLSIGTTLDYNQLEDQEMHFSKPLQILTEKEVFHVAEDRLFSQFGFFLFLQFVCV